MSDVQTPAAQVEADDMEGDIRSALDQLKTDGAVTSEPEAKIILDKDNRVRDETGKFAAKPAEEKPKRETLTLPAKAAEQQQAAPAAVVDPNAPPAAAPILKAPDSWAAPMKEKFGALDPSVQAYIAQREAETHKALTAQDSERQFGKQVKDITAPYMAQIHAEGGDPLKAYQLYLNTAHVLRGNNPVAKAQSIAGVMQQFGVDPNMLLSVLQGGNVQSGAQFQPVQPQQDVAQIVQAELAKQRQIQEETELQGEIENFESQPGHEHFSQLKPVMAALLTSGQAKDLQDAYDQASWANPEIRSILSAQTTGDAEKKRLTELTAKADAAKRASGSVTGSPGGARALNGSSNPNSSIEDDLRAAMREHAGRV